METFYYIAERLLYILIFSLIGFTAFNFITYIEPGLSLWCLIVVFAGIVGVFGYFIAESIAQIITYFEKGE